MGHNVSKSKRTKMRYAAEMSRYKLPEVQKLPSNIHQNKKNLTTRKKPVLAAKYGGEGWVRSLSLEEEYESQSFIPDKAPKMTDPRTQFVPQVSAQSPRRTYQNRTDRTASLHRQKELNVSENRFYDDKPFHSQSSTIYTHEMEPPKKQPLKSWNDHHDDCYSNNASTNSQNVPYSYNSMTKSQHRFDEESNHKYKWNVPAPNNHPAVALPAPGIMGPRVLPSPSHVPERLHIHPSTQSFETESQKPRFSYEDLDSIYRAVGDGIQVAGNISNRSKQSLTMTSSETSPEIFETYNDSTSNNNYTRMQSEQSYTSRYNGNQKPPRNIFRPNEDDPSMYSSNTMDRRSTSLKRYYSQQRLDRSRVISSSASEESDENEHLRRRRQNRTISQSQTNFGRSSNQHYQSESNKKNTGTFERRSKQRPYRELSINRSPEVEREQPQYRSSGPNSAIWQNNDEGMKPQNYVEEQPSTYRTFANEQPHPPPGTGTLTRRSFRNNSETTRDIPKNFSPDDLFLQDEQINDCENVSEKSYQQSTMTIQRSGRRSNASKLNLTRSAIDLGDQSWKRNTLPSKMENLIHDITREEKMNSSNQTVNRRKKRRRKKENESRDSPPASTQELEKIIESQLAAALTSVMTQRK